MSRIYTTLLRILMEYVMENEHFKESMVLLS